MYSKKYLFPLSIAFLLLFSVELPAEEKEEFKEPELKKEETVEKEESHYFTPLQISFFSPLQVFPSSFSVYGLKLDIPYGRNKSIVGFDIGIANESENLYGVGCAAFVSRRLGEMHGLNIAGIYNFSDGNDRGVSIAGLYNEVENVHGLQMSALATRARKVNGIQIGLLNTTHKLNGIQIGILNYCKDQPFKYTLFINFWDSGARKKK